MLDVIDEALKVSRKRILEIDEIRFSIVGDIHGDLNSLERILKRAYRPVIFLGDYGDRGEKQVDVYRNVLQGYIDGEYILLRGNHETTTCFPHDLPFQLRKLDDGEEIYKKLQGLWEKLPWCGIVNGEVFAVHGGVYTKDCRIVEEGIELRELRDERAFLELVWNDPWEKERCDHNFDRGVGYFFGKMSTKRFLEDLDLEVVVRSHQPYKVLKAEQDGMVVTVGSTGVYGTEIAFLNIDGKIGNGYEMVGKYGYVL